MTRGAIYWHFKDKTALFQAMCDRAFLPMDALLNEIISAPGKEPLIALRQMTVHFLRQVASDQRQRKVFDIIFHRCESTEDMPCFVLEHENGAECISKWESMSCYAVSLGKLPHVTTTGVGMTSKQYYRNREIHQ